MRVELQDISKVIMGQSPKGESYNENGIGLPLLNGAADYKGNIFKPKKYTSDPTRVAQKGDILLGIRATIGNFAFSDAEYCIGRGVAAIRVDEKKADKGYILKCVERELSRIIHRASGSTIKGIKKEDLTEIKLNLPPLDQQKKIAAILDAADGYRQKTKALIAKYDELTQSLFLDMFGDPVTNPKGWDKRKLKDITTKIGSGATPKGGKDAYKSEGISLVRSLNVHDNHFKYKDLAFIDNDQASKLNNVTIEEWDVLFNITGASVCRCCIVPSEIIPARVNQHVSILRPDKSIISSFFLMFCLISDNVKQTLLGIGGQGGATREAITKSDLEGFELINPPIELQNQFTHRVKAIEEQKAQAQESLAKAEELFNSLLQKAFKGELT